MIAPRIFQLPLLREGKQRPTYAQGPRDLSALKLFRISVTDRCNLRCTYCMPEEGVEFQDRSELLTPEEFEMAASAAVELGVRHLKITGGEPTVRRDLLEIVERLASLDIEDLSLTTNGLQLPRLAEPLRERGVDRVTISVDSLQPEKYRLITRGGRLDVLHRGLEVADRLFDTVKLNVVVLRGINEEEVADFAALTFKHNWTVRFIEYMPLGESQFAEQATADTVVSANEIAERIVAVHGPLKRVERSKEAGVGPAEVYSLPGARGRVGFIHAMSQPFCESCNRLRLTAKGELRSCLFDGGEISLIDALRSNDLDVLREAFVECLAMKPSVHSSRGNRAMSQLGG